MIHYLVYIEGKFAPAVFILPFMRQNRQCHFVGQVGYGPEFRRGYGCGLGCRFVEMGMGQSRS